MTNSTQTLLLISLLILLFVSAFFSCSETSLMAINRYRLRHLAQQGNRTAKLIEKLLQRPDRLLGIILIGNTLANILASSIGTLLALHFFGNAGVAIITGLLTCVILIFGETLPKTFAATFPRPTAFVIAWPLVVLLIVFYPFVWLMNVIVNSILAMFRVRIKTHKAEQLNRDELRTVLYESAAVMPARHRDMLVGLLDLEKITVEDIMNPRQDIVGIDLNDEWDDILEQLSSATKIRLPVYRDNIDDVIGVIDIHHVLNLLANENFNKKTLADSALAPYFILDHTPLMTQLLNFQKEKRQYALVVDEYGDIQGEVSLAAILEEIVGEFVVDSDMVSQDIHKQDDGSYVVDASMTVRELNKVMHWSLPEEGPKTLSGLVIERLEDIPQPKTSIRINCYSIEVLQVKDNVLRTVRMRVLD